MHMVPPKPEPRAHEYNKQIRALTIDEFAYFNWECKSHVRFEFGIDNEPRN